MKVKVFAWLVVMDRINTKDMIQCRHWKIDDTPDCVLCHAHLLEDRNHLFSCVTLAAGFGTSFILNGCMHLI